MTFFLDYDIIFIENKKRKVNIMIDNFRGKYFFLSNFYEAPVIYRGIQYSNNEAAFQAQKLVKQEERFKFSLLNPSEAKRLGRSVKLRPDWEEIKEKVMYEICLEKFTQNLDLKRQLLDTLDEELVEGNNWGDKTWGKVNGEGKNLLGKILMKVREELRK